MDRRVQIVIAKLHEDIHREVPINDIARLVNLSPSHLLHLFKEQTGTSPTRYLKTLRLERARELLATTFLSVKQVMTNAGLRNQSHFVKDFKKAYGMTPAQYRRTISN